MAPLLEPLGPDLWSQPDSIRIGPFDLPRRSVVVRLSSGGLLVHGPNRRTDALDAALAELGPLEHLVAPNTFHHAHLEDWRARHPRALLWGAPKLAAKRPDLPFDRELGPGPDPAWADVLDQRVLDDGRDFSEVLFLHRPTRTLIVTDAAFNLGREAPPLVRLLMRLNGAYGRLGPTRMFRRFVADPRRVRDQVLAACEAWQFDAVHVSHGEPVRAGARAELVRAWSKVR